jgi:hypothetical protein
MLELPGDLLKAMGEVMMKHSQATSKEPEEMFFTQYAKWVSGNHAGWLRRFHP